MNSLVRASLEWTDLHAGNISYTLWCAHAGRRAETWSAFRRLVYRVAYLVADGIRGWAEMRLALSTAQEDARNGK